MVVCHCLALNDRTITELCTDGPVTVDDVVAQCGAGGRCGGCRPTIEALLADRQARSATPVRLGSATEPNRVASAA
ncbi:(2Fe-2S)-binding protein [Candidatus Neomicrothrix parvicella]|jgi:bacterioferritin-associated ferredoxin|uniref:(2Fe-2S)-binding protein n=1 Tax=Candidatus Neomicrothrix TaxID=41949 RepID=UPI0004B843B7